MTDILEGPKFSEEVAAKDLALLERPLACVEQIILLARCHFLWATHNPNDEMILEHINALSQRVLVTLDAAKPDAEREKDGAFWTAEPDPDGPMMTANWLTFSCGLWYRCRAEHHRNKTRERAAFQLEALVNQFTDEKPSAGHRLLVVHSAGYPARFHLELEMGLRMMRMGMVSTAHEKFKKLRMWSHAVDCLIVAGRNVEAVDMVKELLDTRPGPRLWCCLGELEKDPRHFETAWELSGQRYARAQRSLGRHLFKENDLSGAVRSFSLALEINPLHSGIWFTMGCAQLKLERWDDAVQTFSRSLGIEDENSESWANLAAAHLQLGANKEARHCIGEATRRARQNWRMWESYLGISTKIRDVTGMIQGASRLAELEAFGRIPENILGMLCMCVITDADGLLDKRTGQAFKPQLMKLFGLLTSKCASEPCYWRFLADLQAADGDHELAMESRTKHSRAAQAKLWKETDPATFSLMLEDLKDCFESVEAALGSALTEKGKELLQSFAYSVRNAEKQLQEKIASGTREPDWVKNHEVIAAIATRLEASKPKEDKSVITNT